MGRKGYAVIIFIAIATTLLIAGGVRYYEAHRMTDPQMTASQITFASSTVHAISTPVTSSGTSPVATSTAATSTGIRVPVSIYDGLYGSRSQITTPFVNTSTAETITLRQTGGAGGNLTFEAYLNGQDVGEVDGALIGFFGFSPDNKYFGIRTGSNSGAADTDYILDILDLANKKPIYIKAPSVNSSTPQPSGYETFPVIASSSWNSDDSINVTAYMAVGDYNNQTKQLIYYRISPVEVWQYSLNTGSYTFLQALPETSPAADQ